MGGRALLHNRLRPPPGACGTAAPAGPAAGPSLTPPTSATLPGPAHPQKSSQRSPAEPGLASQCGRRTGPGQDQHPAKRPPPRSSAANSTRKHLRGPEIASRGGAAHARDSGVRKGRFGAAGWSCGRGVPCFSLCLALGGGSMK